MQIPKIIITAYNCSPGKGSEHSCGWNHIYHIAKYLPVTVITEESYRPDFEKNKHLLNNITIEYVKHPLSLSFLNTLDYPLGFYFTYRFWEKKVYRYLLKKKETDGFDLINRITVGAVKEPGYSWKIDVPYIWNEAHIPEFVPFRFFKLFSLKTSLIFAFLNMSRWLILNTGPRCRKAFTKANYVFASNKESKRLFQKHFNRECGICYEAGGILPLDSLPIQRRNEHEPFRIVWVGRIIDFKGLELVIRSVALLPQELNYELIIAGEGNDKQRLEILSKELNIKAKFLGSVPFTEIPALFASSHCYPFTSFKDGITNSILESLSNNCPVICLNHLTFGELIDESIGLKVDVNSIDQIVIDLSEKIQFLYQNEDYRLKLIRNIPQRLKNCTWDYNARMIIKSYEQALKTKILN